MPLSTIFQLYRGGYLHVTQNLGKLLVWSNPKSRMLEFEYVHVERMEVIWLLIFELLSMLF